MTIIFAYLDEPPFCAPTADGPVGCDVEVAFAVLHAIGVERIETRLVTFAELLPGVASGAWQINTPLFITEERARLVEFSRPVWSLADGLMVQAGNPKRLTSYRTLAAHTDAGLVVVADQVQEQRALAAGLALARVLRVATQPEAVAAVRDGRSDAYASVAMAHRGFLRAAPSSTPKSTTASPASGAAAEGAYSFAKSNADLRRAFDGALQRFLGSPEHRATMRRYHFTDADVERVL